jgi:hypothetical protein
METTNPYQQPVEEGSAETVASARAMPASIYAVLAALFILLVLQSQSAALALLGSHHEIRPVADILAPVLQLVVFVGILARKRFAWVWGRFLAGLQVLLNVYTAGVLGRAYQQGDAPLATVLVICFCFSLYVVMSIGLGQRSAKEYFQFVCPKCGVPTTKGLDLLYRRVSCRTCGGQW